jgi:hypothetical protein
MKNNKSTLPLHHCKNKKYRRTFQIPKIFLIIPVKYYSQKNKKIISNLRSRKVTAKEAFNSTLTVNIHHQIGREPAIYHTMVLIKDLIQCIQVVVSANRPPKINL